MHNDVTFYPFLALNRHLASASYAKGRNNTREVGRESPTIELGFKLPYPPDKMLKYFFCGKVILLFAKLSIVQLVVALLIKKLYMIVFCYKKKRMCLFLGI